MVWLAPVLDGGEALGAGGSGEEVLSGGGGLQVVLRPRVLGGLVGIAGSLLADQEEDEEDNGNDKSHCHDGSDDPSGDGSSIDSTAGVVRHSLCTIACRRDIHSAINHCRLRKSVSRGCGLLTETYRHMSCRRRPASCQEDSCK